MKDTYTNITTLSSQTQTASVVSQTNNYYSTLQSTGEEWFIDFRALIVLSAFTIGFLIQDLMILLTYSVRKISIKALSKSMLFLFILDLVYSGLAIYWVIKFIYFYNIDRSLSRSEEKYYRMLLEIETNKLQPMHWFMYFIWVLIVRLFHYLIYFDEVGFSVLIEIMVKMTIKVFRFLVLFFIIILAFSFVGYGLFYDVEDYSTLIKSFNTMFKSSLGGFDYSLYDNSTISSSTAGRIYLSIYLLTSTKTNSIQLNKTNK